MKKILTVIAVVMLASCQTKIDYNVSVDNVQLVASTSVFNSYKIQIDSVVYIVTTIGGGVSVIRHGVVSDSTHTTKAKW